jgi:hypothetical protein
MKGIASTGAPKTLLGGWVDGWMGGKAGLRIAYSNQKWQYFTIKLNMGFNEYSEYLGLNIKMYLLLKIVLFLLKNSNLALICHNSFSPIDSTLQKSTFCHLDSTLKLTLGPLNSTR